MNKRNFMHGTLHTNLLNNDGVYILICYDLGYLCNFTLRVKSLNHSNDYLEYRKSHVVEIMIVYDFKVFSLHIFSLYFTSYLDHIYLRRTPAIYNKTNV